MISYSELLLQAQTLATALSDPRPPKCALVLLPKVPAWWVVNVAASWCGKLVGCAVLFVSFGECGEDLHIVSLVQLLLW